MKKHATTILLVLILLAGVGLLAYPSLADWWNGLHQSRVIATYADSLEAEEKPDYTALWAAADDYNAGLLTAPNRFEPTAEEDTYYRTLLNVTGILGVIRIEPIDVNLPVYHGTEDDVLQVGIGHVVGTSLPTGQKGTHTALSGHRGLPSAKLFTDLDRVQEGDLFTLTVLDRTLTFQVDQILVVLPGEIDALAIDPDMCYCTLITCTPYGINSHRMLVRGHLVETPEAPPPLRITQDATQVEPLVAAGVVAVPVLIVLVILLLIGTSGKQSNRKER